MKTSFAFCCYSLFVLATVVIAQSSRPTPTLTTDDVMSSRPTVAAPLTPAVEKPADKGEKSGAPANPQSTPTESSVDPKKAAEKEWNDRLRQAQEKARELGHQGDQTELMITQLRNQLFSAASKAPETSGQITAQINDLSGRLNRLRAEAKAAQQQVDALGAEGASKQFKAQSAVLTNGSGQPDQKAYQSEYDRLQSELQASQARIGVLQMRLNSNQQETFKRGNGDNFTLNRLRAEKEQTTNELNETRTKIENLTNQIQAHRQKASAAGVALGTQ